MSRIFLPNGGQIEVHNNGWTQTRGEDGTLTYKDKDGNLLFTISVSGTVHFASGVSYTYYPPPINSLDDAYLIVSEQIRKLSWYKLRDLKAALQDFNAKSGSWKS